MTPVLGDLVDRLARSTDAATAPGGHRQPVHGGLGGLRRQGPPHAPRARRWTARTTCGTAAPASSQRARRTSGHHSTPPARSRGRAGPADPNAWRKSTEIERTKYPPQPRRTRRSNSPTVDLPAGDHLPRRARGLASPHFRVRAIRLSKRSVAHERLDPQAHPRVTADDVADLWPRRGERVLDRLRDLIGLDTPLGDLLGLRAHTSGRAFRTGPVPAPPSAPRRRLPYHAPCSQIGVTTAPGSMIETLIPQGRSSRRSESLTASSPNLEAA